MPKAPRPATERRPGFKPVADLQVRAAQPALVRASAGACSLELSVLAEDLFRLRLVKGRVPGATHSWCMTRAQEPMPDAEVSHTARTVEIGSTQGRLSVNLADGGWVLRDAGRLELFRCVPGSMGYMRHSPRLNLALAEGEAIFGLGESSGTFNKRGLIREFWNIDVGGHARVVHAHLRNMYVAIPFGISLRNGRAAGLFWDNPGHQVWDVGQTQLDHWQLQAERGALDLYLFLGPTCESILERFTEWTGRMPLPPLWSLGYQQCRYSYESRRRVEEVARAFRQKRIPCDVLYLDIHYMDGYRVFTFGQAFPHPAAMISGLAKQGFKTVTIIDPGVKDDPRFPVLQRGKERRAFVKAADGQSDYLGKVWPGQVRFPDFLSERARLWWGEEQARLQRLGVAGFWNDMNEPADFSAPGKDFPAANIHQTELGTLRHAEVHNVYGSQMARASYEGALRHEPTQRPFIITRAGYAGVQRYASVWTGDNDSSWEHLADSVQMLLNLSLSGVAFCGADVGGFHHSTTGELLARWTQLGAFTPFFRNHSNIGTVDQEPWAFGPDIEGICRDFIELRYQLLPYLYSLFVQAHRRGTPIIRPLFWHYQNDPFAAAAGDQFLLGPDLLIAPVLRQGATARSVYLPPGTWFNFWTGVAVRGGQHVLAAAGLETMPIFVRAGAILPVIPVQQYVGEQSSSTVSLHIWPGGSGDLLWYEDDGSTREYEQGAVYERDITLRARGSLRRLVLSAARGRFATGVRKWRVVLRQVERRVRPKLGPRSIPAVYNRELAYCIFEVENRPEQLEVGWV